MRQISQNGGQGTSSALLLAPLQLLFTDLWLHAGMLRCIEHGDKVTEDTAGLAANLQGSLRAQELCFSCPVNYQAGHEPILLELAESSKPFLNSNPPRNSSQCS